jgi:hypothetical protein
MIRILIAGKTKLVETDALTDTPAVGENLELKHAGVPDVKGTTGT